MFKFAKRVQSYYFPNDYPSIFTYILKKIEEEEDGNNTPQQPASPPTQPASPPTPLRMERDVICPADCHFAIKRGSNAFFVQQVAVITPLSIRRGVGGEAVLVLRLLFYKQLDIPSVVAMAVSTEIITLRIVFHFSFFILLIF